MSLRLKHFSSIMIPVVNTAFARGLIDKSAPWLPFAAERLVRFHDTIDGDIPVAVDVGRWENGLLYVYWALWPTAPDVTLEQPLFGYFWPSDVWGWGQIDRRADLQLNAFGDDHCRVPRKRRVAKIKPVSIDPAMTTLL